MKKILVFLTLILIVAGCMNNDLKNNDNVKYDIYTYDVSYWKKSDDIKRKEIVNEILTLWKNNNELFNVNFQVNVDSLKERIVEYTIKENDDKIILDIACDIVGIDYTPYKNKN